MTNECYLLIFFRLYEESRNNRMRIEAARAHNAAVLRQQIFYFDPAQEMLNADASSVVSGGPAGGGDYSQAPLQPHQAPPMPQQQPRHGGLHESSFVSAAPASIAVNLTPQQQQQLIQQQQLRSRLNPQSASPTPSLNQPVYTQLNGAPVPTSHGMMNSAGIASNQQLNPTQMRIPQHSSAVNNKQEELLRQLFPSWF